MSNENITTDFVVRYGVSRLLGIFTWKGKQPLQRGNNVIVRSKRGHEWGEILSPATERAVSFLNSSEPEGRIQRHPNAEDYAQRDECHVHEEAEFRGCNDLIAEYKLQMQLVDVEHLFGGERAIFYFVAEKRVDFRELVKALAKKFSLRIEMRQIGVRDEAAMLADYGDCGKPVCCNTHLTEMPPVSMKMAKVQKATLDPNKISGRCGRLKCCLRYEYDTYEEFRRELPKVGAQVVTREGQGKVIAHEILTKHVIVAYEDRRRITTPLQEIVSVLKPSKANKKADKPTTEAAAEETKAASESDTVTQERPKKSSGRRRSRGKKPGRQGDNPNSGSNANPPQDSN